MSASSSALRCEQLSFAVSRAEGEPTDLEVIGWLCSRGGLDEKTIQVLIHGATYDHNVWDFPYRPDRYSYVRAATAAGYATLNLDRLGHGRSSRLTGDVLDLEVGAFALHQIVQALRSGEIETHRFGPIEAEKILLAGESAGGTLAWMEAGLYDDVDGIVVAGAAHTFAEGLERVMRATWPVESDPLLRHRGTPPGYFTTIPGTRGLIYYHLPEVDPIVLLVDELLKQTLTSGEIAGLPASLPLSELVDVPTLVTVGDFDDLFCHPPSCTESGSLDAELETYGPGSCAELLIMPES
ncbi:MAG TPA: alpha/beta hydrolase, partial [Kofleriaceae bacterium]|nr:alpha/beta hydrolase [Kofleriaceae bacterium]